MKTNILLLAVCVSLVSYVLYLGYHPVVMHHAPPWSSYPPTFTDGGIEHADDDVTWAEPTPIPGNERL